MPLPVNARVQAAQTFVRDVRAAQAFLVQQDSVNADARYRDLLALLSDARSHIRWNPAAGRPARFLQAQSTQVQMVAARAVAIAKSHGLPHLRELVVKPYVVLYAHGDDRVLLLALKHEREFGFRVG